MAVQLTINGHDSDAADGSTLFECAERIGVAVPTSCQKQGKCKECIVEVTEGMELLSPRSGEESHLKDGFRLACRCRVASAEGAVGCHTLRRGHLRIERQAFELPTLNRPLKLEPAVRRVGDRVFVGDDEVDARSGPLHGLAIDLGTTTIVVRLFDLETGEQIADASLENPQRFGGSDVMARIVYDTQHPGKLLMRTVAGYLSRTIQELPVDPRTIYEVVVVGNSTMRDLFFRQDVYSIGQSPYRSITELDVLAGKRATTSLVQSGRKSLLPIHPAARVYGGPIISGHLGADAAACMLAVELAREDRLVAIMDIGTNTELILGNRERILAASCPAGPAFEGGAIACGMPGLEGAIESVAIDSSGNFRTRVIGDKAPEGICGSGLIELLSELLRTGRMNPLGRFEDELPRSDFKTLPLPPGEGRGEGGSATGNAPSLCPLPKGEGFETASSIAIDERHGIFLFERDVNELAQAKGANVAGLFTVFDEYGVDFEDVDVFYLAGGFGRHVNVDAARRIGLIPPLADSKIVKVGNAAIEGASMALLSTAKRRELEALVRTVEHCRLETHPRFFDFFVEGCQFKPVQSACEAAP